LCSWDSFLNWCLGLFKDNPCQATMYNTALLYTWTTVAPMSISRDAVGVCLLGDQLYAVGGYDGQSYLNTVEISVFALLNVYPHLSFSLAIFPTLYVPQ
uniref:Uncharacterized protein n=1 Tax=Scleropages formosus TaxID=113540 RepID=A0A8C9U760_SCLFO